MIKTSKVQVQVQTQNQWAETAHTFRISEAVNPASTGWRAVRRQPNLPAASRGSLSVLKTKTRRHSVGSRAPILVEAKANTRWSLDFVHDQLACGRRFRVLNVVDDVTRECVAAIPDTSISGRRVAQESTALIERRGKPGMIVSDNCPELTSNVIFVWSKDHKVEWRYIAPGEQLHFGTLRCQERGPSTTSGQMEHRLANAIGETLTIKGAGQRE